MADITHTFGLNCGESSTIKVRFFLLIPQSACKSFLWFCAKILNVHSTFHWEFTSSYLRLSGMTRETFMLPIRAFNYRKYLVEDFNFTNFLENFIHFIFEGVVIWICGFSFQFIMWRFWIIYFGILIYQRLHLENRWNSVRKFTVLGIKIILIYLQMASYFNRVFLISFLVKT